MEPDERLLVQVRLAQLGAVRRAASHALAPFERHFVVDDLDELSQRVAGGYSVEGCAQRLEVVLQILLCLALLGVQLRRFEVEAREQRARQCAPPDGARDVHQAVAEE